MDSKILKKIEEKYIKNNTPAFKVGDTVDVGTIIREGDKKRIQRFKGVVIGIKGSGTAKTFTVRKISYGIGVEKIFPLNSTNISDIVVLKHGKARRAKLNYLRSRVGKLALKVKQGKATVLVEGDAGVENDVEAERVAEVENNSEEATEVSTETTEEQA